MLWPKTMIRTDHNHWEEHSAVSKLLTLMWKGQTRIKKGARNLNDFQLVTKLMQFVSW